MGTIHHLNRPMKNVEDMSVRELEDIQARIARMYEFNDKDYEDIYRDVYAQKKELGPWTKVTVFICNTVIAICGLVLFCVFMTFMAVFWMALTR